MFNNTTHSSPQSNCKFSDCGNEMAIYATSSVVAYSSAIFIAIFSPVAVSGNTLILAAIWKNPSLRTPSYILLAGLAFTDFGTGLLTQPTYVATELIRTVYFELIDKKPTVQKQLTVAGSSFSIFFSSCTILLVTLMSIERWLHMSRRSWITVRRTYIITAVLTVVPLTLTVCRATQIITRDSFTREINTAFVLFALLCLTITTVAYFKLFRIIRRHQQQIQANELSHNFGQPVIDFIKYKKSVFSILYILILFYIGYLPVSISLMLMLFLSPGELTMIFFHISMVLLFLSSSLNPLLYLWRMKDIREEVKHLLKRMLCKVMTNENDS